MGRNKIYFVNQLVNQSKTCKRTPGFIHTQTLLFEAPKKEVAFSAMSGKDKKVTKFSITGNSPKNIPRRGDT